MAAVGGPFRDLKWGGITFYPVKDSDAEWKKNTSEFETDISPNGEPYSTYNSAIGYVQQECVMTPDQYDAYLALNDGTARAGIATAPDGSVISVNGNIDGEVQLAGGKITVRIAGKVRVQ